MTQPLRTTTRQLRTALSIAVMLSGVLALVGHALMYLGDVSAVRILREEGAGDLARQWERNVAGRLVIGGLLAVGLVAAGGIAIRRLWSSTQRHDFALVVGLLVALAGGPVVWGATFAVAEAAFRR